MRRPLWMTGFLALALAANGEFIENPDPNTLWIEDGGRIATGPNAQKGVWGDGMKVAPREGGGFSFIFEDEKNYSSGVYVPWSPEYPYWVVQIDAFSRIGTGYRNFFFGSLYKLPSVTFWMCDLPQPGLMVWKAFTDDDAPAAQVVHSRSDMYGFKVDFRYVKMVKVPDNYMVIESTGMKEHKELRLGDQITFTVILQKPAEDVSLRLFDSYCMPQMKLNGQDTLQLKPEEKVGAPADSVWSTTVKVDTLEGYLKVEKEKTQKVRILVKAVTLGGGLKVPLWTPMPYPYAAVNE